MTIRATAIAVVLTSLVVFVLHESAALMAPIFVSLLIAYALDPIVNVLMRLRVSRVGAAILTYVLLAVLTGSLTRLVVTQVDAFVADLPGAVSDATRMWAAAAAQGPPSPIEHVRRAARELNGAVDAQKPPAPPDVNRVQVESPPFNVDALLASAGVSFAVVATEAAGIGLLSFLMICAGDLYRRKLITIGGRAFQSRRLTIEVIRAIDVQIQRYLLRRLLISATVAAATPAGLWLVGLSHPLVWGVIAGVLNVVSFIGPTAAVALVAVAAFLQFKAIEPTLLAAGVAMLVAALEGNVITPGLTSRAGEINTVAVFVSVLFWGWLWGVAGLVLAIPIMVAVKAAADHIEPLQPIGELLGL